jgi:hypothetical protein
MGNDINGLPLVRQIRILDGRVKGNKDLLEKMKKDPKSFPINITPEDEKANEKIVEKNLLEAERRLFLAQTEFKMLKSLIEPKLPGTDSGDLFESVDNLVTPDATKTAPKVAKEVKDNKKTAEK